MVQVTYPGVYIQEVSSGVRTITGVATSIAMFVGYTSKGPLNQPTLIFSYEDYKRSFGEDPASVSEMSLQVRQFFANGGTQAYVMRVAVGGSSADVMLANAAGTDTLELKARHPGTDGGQIRAEVDYDTTSPESTFNLRVFRVIEPIPGNLVETESETWGNLSMDPGSPRYVETLLNADSKLVTVDDQSIGGGDTYSISGELSHGVADLANRLATRFTEFTGNGEFRIDIGDGNGFRTVSIADEVEANIHAAVQAATGNAVSFVYHVPGVAYEYMEFSSTTAPYIRILPGLNNDITAAMGLGVEQGGIEISSFADNRPAPTGIFLHWGSTAAEALGAEMEEAMQETLLDRIDITDSGTTYAVTVAPGGGRLTESASAAGDDSFANLRAKLLKVASDFNAHVEPGFDWTAEVHGYRLMLRKVGGDSNAAATELLTASGTNLGLAGKAFGSSKLQVKQYSVGGSGTDNAFQTPGALGGNGIGSNSPADYDAAYNTIAQEVDIFNLLVLPDHSELDETQRKALWGPASTFCQSQRAFLLVDPPSSWKTVSDPLTDPSLSIGHMRVGMVKDHAALYWPRVTVVDPASNTNVDIDPSGSMAGLAARTDANRGVFKAPAGTEASIRGIVGAEVNMSDAENGVINPQAINALRIFPSGIVSWGARTMDGFDNSGNDDYKYVPVRRLALFIEESVYRGLQFAVFEPNGEVLWQQIRQAAGAFMNNLFRQGAFAGTKASDAYFVKCDSETTTQNDINLGIVNVVVGFAPLKPAEFVVVTIQQIAGQVNT